MTRYLDQFSSCWKLLTGIKPGGPVLNAYIQRNNHFQQHIELRGSGIRFHIRSGRDIRNIKETFFDSLYERLGTPIGDGWTIIDIGGGIGDFAVYVASKHPDNVIYIFEPDPEAFSLLVENLRLNDVDKAQAFQQAIWSQSGNLAIDELISSPETASLYSTAGDKKIAASLSLADAFERIGLAHCNLLKIDCRGAEYEILINTPDGIFERTERIIMQYHANGTPDAHKELQEFLNAKGYAVKMYPSTAHPDLGYLYASR